MTPIATALFSVPTNILQRDETRIFVRRMGESWGATEDKERYAVMFWVEFGTQGRAFRPLRGAHGPDASNADISKDETVQLIELGVGHRGEAGSLACIALDAGFLKVTEREGVRGIELAGFSDVNPHFLPGFKSMQAKGATASAESKRKKHDTAAAGQQRQLLDQQGKLSFEASPQEVERAIALIMQLDRLAKRKARLTSEYESSLLERAVWVLRNYTAERIDTVTKWLLLKREDVSVIQGSDAVLLRWEEYLERSGL